MGFSILVAAAFVGLAFGTLSTLSAILGVVGVVVVAAVFWLWPDPAFGESSDRALRRIDRNVRRAERERYGRELTPDMFDRH